MLTWMTSNLKVRAVCDGMTAAGGVGIGTTQIYIICYMTKGVIVYLYAHPRDGATFFFFFFFLEAFVTAEVSPSSLTWSVLTCV